MNNYCTDVYAYYDEDTKEVTLDTFVNPGGNSWLNDNHYMIYRDEQHNETVYDGYSSESELLAAATNYDELEEKEEMRKIIEKIAEEEDINIEDVEKEVDRHTLYSYVRMHIEDNETLLKQLHENYAEEAKSSLPDYARQAEEIISELEEALKEVSQ